MAPRSKKDGLYEITLLRHGESTGNLEGRVQGRSDYPLTKRGLQQAKALARHWQAEKVSFDKIISSPSQRARKTAEIIAESLSLPVELDPAWMERGFGEWEGLVLEEILQIKPDIDFFHPPLSPGRKRRKYAGIV